MVFAEYYHKSTGWNGNPVIDIPMCGSDSVLQLSGRLSITALVREARAHMNRHFRKDEMTGFVIRAGTFLHSRPLTKFIPKSSDTVGTNTKENS